MGRVIKFKAKRLDNGEWEEGSLFLSERGKVCIGTMLDSNEENGTPVCFKCREGPFNRLSVHGDERLRGQRDLGGRYSS